MPRAVKTKAAAAQEAPAAKKAAGKKNKLYEMPEKIVEGTVLEDLYKVQWRVGPSIGTGGFGEIYTTCRVDEKNYDYVIKCEPHLNGPLFVEMHFYIRNAKVDDITRFKKQHGLKSLGMPYVVGHGSQEVNGKKHRFLVMPRYGSDIQKYFLENGRRIPEGTAYRIAIQMLHVYEFVHSCDFVHADLKGANILLGIGKQGKEQVYLVDYGLASHCVRGDFKPDPKKMHNGTIEYTSRDAHQGVPTMRGDLEILGYNLIEWLGVELPWVRDKLLATPVKVQKSKEDFMADLETNLKKIFIKGVPVPIADLMKYVVKMKYNERPDYEFCRNMFSKALKTMHIVNSGELVFNIKTAKNNNEVPTTSKPKLTKKQIIAQESDDSSVEEVSATDDDDDFALEQRRRPTKAAPAKTAKAILSKTKKRTPTRPVLSKRSPKLSPLNQKRRSPQKTPIVGSPALGAGPKVSPSPQSKASKKSLISPQESIHAKTSTSAKKLSPRSASAVKKAAEAVSNATRSTPVSNRARLNFSPAISVSSGSRHGKTIINDNLTPNPRPAKTYEFNFELDVSMDANVVVNVKRKKKAPKESALAGSKSSVTNGSQENDAPVTRVKVRKIGSADDERSSSQSPAVIVKHSRKRTER